MYIVFFLLSRPPWKSAIAEGVSVNKYSFNNNNNNNNKRRTASQTRTEEQNTMYGCLVTEPKPESSYYRIFP